MNERNNRDGRGTESGRLRNGCGSILRVGEYTRPHDRVVTRTAQFRVCDVRLWQGQTLLPPHSNPATLAAASSAMLTVDNQKNGQRGNTVHQEACSSDFCPVRSIVALVSAVMAQDVPVTTPLSYVQPGIHAQPPMILLTGRRGICLANLEGSGYDLTRVGAHSLRVSGAMSLWLSGHSPEAIMKMGWWRTQTFLTYIHSQIAPLNHRYLMEDGTFSQFPECGWVV